MKKIDLHIHTVFSDGTDTPEVLISHLKEEGISLFSVTDHDGIKGSYIFPGLLKEEDPEYIPGVEFSCRDEYGKYHILGYGYDPYSEGINHVVDTGHGYRMKKFRARLEFLKEEFGFVFTDDELDELFAMNNPGKPHIGNLMVKHGYAATKEQAIKQYIDKIRFKNEYIHPEVAIKGILASGGIPVLAHPSYGSGDQLIIGDEMEERIKRLIGFGLQGVEAFYSGFTAKLRDEILGYAKRYDLYVTAGSDYHGSNKLVELGDTGLDDDTDIPEGMVRFLNKISKNAERS